MCWQRVYRSFGHSGPRRLPSLVRGRCIGAVLPGPCSTRLTLVLLGRTGSQHIRAGLLAPRAKTACFSTVVRQSVRHARGSTCCFLAKVVALGRLTSSLLSHCLPYALFRRAKGAGNTTPHKKPAHAQSTAHRSVLRHTRQGEFLFLLPHVAHGADYAVSFRCVASNRTVGTLCRV